MPDRHPMWAEVDDTTYAALCNCCNNYNEIPILARSMYHYKKKKNPDYSPEDALVDTLDQLDANGQSFLYDMQRWQYDEILGGIV